MNISNLAPRWITDPYGVFRELVLPVVFLSAGILGLGALLVAGARYMDGVSCKEKGVAMNIDTHWGFWTGCMIKVSGQLLPWSEVVPVSENGRIVFKPRPHVRLAPAEE